MANRRNRNIQPDNDIGGNPGYNNSNPAGSGGQFNMNNLGQMLNNMDINQLMGQLSQMMGAPPGGAQGGFQNGPPGGFQNGPPPGFQPQKSTPKDTRYQLLQAMKPFLSKKRGKMVDNIGQLYSVAAILRKINKKG